MLKVVVLFLSMSFLSGCGLTDPKFESSYDEMPDGSQKLTCKVTIWAELPSTDAIGSNLNMFADAMCGGQAKVSNNLVERKKTILGMTVTDATLSFTCRDVEPSSWGDTAQSLCDGMLFVDNRVE